MKRKGQPAVRFPVRLPNELWRVLATDDKLRRTRVLGYYEPSMNYFILDLIYDQLREGPNPDSFAVSKPPLYGEPVQIAVRLPTDLYKEFRIFCVKAGTSMNETIIEWLWRDESVRDALKHHRYI